MTSAQILTILGAGNMDARLYIDDIKYIAFYGKDKNPKFSEIDKIRFLFDTTNEILEVSFCRPYSQNLLEIPEHGQYDQLDYNGIPTIFEYLVDINGDLIVDYYSFDSISAFVLRGV